MVTLPPVMEGFKPFGIPIADLEPVILLYEEYEAIRLLDYLGMTQVQAAREMAVSRPTLTRIYEKARRSVASAFVEGKAIFIEGGDYYADGFWYRCESCHKLVISDKEISECLYCNSDNLRAITGKLSQMNQQKQEDHPGHCICLRCNVSIPHQPGVPCRESKCPQCGKKMVRENSYHHQLYLKKKQENENRDSQ